jgi:hypothetical protein
VEVSYDKKSITFTRARGFTGTASMQYTVYDNGPHYRTGTISVVVPNRVPVANADSVRTPRTVAVTIWPLSNDFDPDGQALQLVTALVTLPTRGTASVNAAVRSIRYTPSSTFTSGTDSLRYRIFDGAGGSAIGSVTITVFDQCAGNQCTPTPGYNGTCSFATGCTCLANSGLRATTITLGTSTTPTAACRFFGVTPGPTTLGRGYVRAPSPGARVALRFSLGSPAQCFTRRAVRSTNGVTISSSTACSGSGTAPVLLSALASSTALGESCTYSVYQIVWQAPAAAGCYNLSINLVDSTSIRVLLLV